MPLFEVILKQSIPHPLQLFAYFVISMSLCLKELFSSCKMVLHRECPPRAMPIKFLKGYKIYAATCHRYIVLCRTRISLCPLDLSILLFLYLNGTSFPMALVKSTKKSRTEALAQASLLCCHLFCLTLIY